MRPSNEADIEAANLFGAAYQYWDTTRVLVGLPNAMERWMAFYFLTGFSLELSFKAVIAKFGESPRVYSHRLISAYDRTIALGYQPESPQLLAGIVSQLGEYHEDFSFRYLKPDREMVLPNMRMTVRLLDNHLRAVCEQFAPDWDHPSAQTNFGLTEE